MKTAIHLLEPVTSPSRYPSQEAQPIGRVVVAVNHPRDLGRLLDRAVHEVIPIALERRQGILVRQISPNHYTVEADKGVPCGEIQEQRMHGTCQPPAL